jgi:hypothetical protein
MANELTFHLYIVLFPFLLNLCSTKAGTVVIRVRCTGAPQNNTAQYQDGRQKARFDRLPRFPRSSNAIQQILIGAGPDRFSGAQTTRTHRPLYSSSIRSNQQDSLIYI